MAVIVVAMAVIVVAMAVIIVVMLVVVVVVVAVAAASVILVVRVTFLCFSVSWSTTASLAPHGDATMELLTRFLHASCSTSSISLALSSHANDSSGRPA